MKRTFWIVFMQAGSILGGVAIDVTQADVEYGLLTLRRSFTRSELSDQAFVHARVAENRARALGLYPGGEAATVELAHSAAKRIVRDQLFTSKETEQHIDTLFS